MLLSIETVSPALGRVCSIAQLLHGLIIKQDPFYPCCFDATTSFSSVTQQLCALTGCKLAT
eukprot:m.157482 g.157482  ORF g.157482 m.157482 type:complete len:61 (+) comp16451_c0_seq3:1377-1559(+)